MAGPFKCPLARCGEESLNWQLAVVFLQFGSEGRLVKHSAIDDPAWDQYVLNVEVDVDHESIHLAALWTFQ